jgi:hypothetical protein
MPSRLIMTRDLARQMIRDCEDFLAAGHPPPGVPSTGTYGVRHALRMLAEKYGAVPQSIRDQIGSPGKPGSIRRLYGFEVDWSKYQPPTTPSPDSPPPSPTVIDRKYTMLQDENRELRRQLRELHRSHGTEEIIRDIVGKIADTPRTTPEWMTKTPSRDRHKPTPEVPIMIYSDFHIGEVVEKLEVNNFNEYNMSVAEERFHRLIDSTLQLCKDNHVGVYPGAVVCLLGDFVSGGIHPELKATDEEEVIPASIKCVDWLVMGLERLADYFGKLYIPSVTGNHGRTTVRPEFKRYYRKNFDWLILQMLARHFADDKRFQFDIRPSNDVRFRAFGTAYLAAHGDMLGTKGGDGMIGSIGPIIRGEIKQAGQSSGLGYTFQRLLIGHWHQRLWLPRVVVNNAFKGFDEYSMKQLGAKPDRPTQTLWFEHPSYGVTAHWDIYVDDKPPPMGEWVSWTDKE